MKLLNIRILYIVIAFTSNLVFGITTSYAAKQQPYVVRNLDNSWLVYDSEFDSYVPYIPAEHGLVNTANLWLKCHRDSAYSLKIYAEPQLSIYFDNKLYKVFEKADTAYLDLKPLFAQGNKNVFATFYLTGGLQGSLRVALVNRKKNQIVEDSKIKNKATSSSYRVDMRKDSFLEVYIIGILLISTFYIFIKNIASKSFAHFFDWRSLTLGNMDDYSATIRKTWTGFNILIVLADSLCLSFVFFMVQNEYQFSILSFSSEGVQILPNNEWWLVRIPSYWLLALGYFIAKYLLINITGGIFNLNKISAAHYYEFLRTSTLASFVMLIWVIFAYIGKLFNPEEYIYWLQITLIVFAILRVFKMMLMLNKTTNFRNLYLFSYLCATEIAPIILVSQLFRFQ